MSAWIVTENHLRAIVTGAIHYDVIEEGDAQRVGEALEAENRASVNYRYRQQSEQLPYRHEAVKLDEIALLSQAECYVYQSCEHPQWEQSEARRIVEQLRAELRNVLPDGIEETPAYAAAPWGM